MKPQIESAIRETLVIENKQSIHLAVDKIMKINDNLLNSFGNYCVINAIKLTDSNKVGQAVIDFLKSDYYKRTT